MASSERTGSASLYKLVTAFTALLVVLTATIPVAYAIPLAAMLVVFLSRV